MIKSIQADSVDTLQLRRVMFERRLSPATLGHMAKFNPRRISNVLCGTDETWPIRAAINRALGEKIFSRPAHARTPTPKKLCSTS